MTSRIPLVALALFALVCLDLPAAEPGKEKSAACAACHGADGNSSNPLWPNLAGQHPAYIVKQLKAFKSGERQEASMTPMAAPLSEDDMEDIALYYAAQNPSIGVADEQFLERGQQLYRGGNRNSGVPACMACHGPSGIGNLPAGYPALSGQHPDYTAKQLNAYKSGERKTDPAAMMRSIAAKMSAEEIQAIASYLAGLH